jgi:hypothetical protein
LGLLVFIILRYDIPTNEGGLMAAMRGSFSAHNVQELTSLIQEKRTRIEQLEARFAAMSAELTSHSWN